jgi:uncharacterized protein (DUF58 family)
MTGRVGPAGWVRPGRPLSPIPVTAAILATWWLVAHNSGAGWVQVLGDVVFGTLFIGIFGPAVVLARTRIEVLSAPLDATAGLPVEIQLGATTRVRVRPVAPAGIEALAGPVGRDRRGEGAVSLLPPHRATYDTLTFDVASAAPFALQWWTRRVVVALPSTLHVAPRRGKPVPLPGRLHDHAGQRTDRAPAETGDPRGARPYRAGDHQRHVHWRATAHTGELMVREVEGTSAEELRVVVALPRDQEEAERVAECALGTVVALLDRGAPVVLVTSEPTGAVEAAVADRRSAGRRLARAVPPTHQPAAATPIEPVAIEPVAIEPVAIEPVAIEPVAIEPVAIEMVR